MLAFFLFFTWKRNQKADIDQQLVVFEIQMYNKELTLTPSSTRSFLLTTMSSLLFPSFHTPKPHAQIKLILTPSLTRFLATSVLNVCSLFSLSHVDTGKELELTPRFTDTYMLYFFLILAPETPPTPHG